MSIVEVEYSTCAWCGAVVDKPDIARHILTCEKQPLAVYRRALLDGLARETNRPRALLAAPVRNALQYAELQVSRYIREREWEYRS